MARLAKKSASRKGRKPAKTVHRGQAKHHVWTKVELETLNPLLQRQLVTGSNVMLARILLKKGCIVPLHSHHNEQLSYVIEGALKFTIRGKNTLVRSGEVLTIPPHVPHLVKAMRDTVSLDIFHPPRMDWINKTDSYLRR
ncbi:MAG TPA: cupin domain-containing protein [Terriglobales bacterium]|nr:cupin domain-containing protein [Terriglobales bacterium]